jgi:methyltransferase (TIGR00027 family)
MSDATIYNVADTALWIAGYRAQETERDDHLFLDPLAKKLAGDRGMEMVATTPHTEAMGFAMVIRTIAIDRLVLSAIARGVDTVINLGAGLDTRPYRMKLPSTLRWIEVDFPSMIDFKNEKLKNDQPVCQLRRIACDLTNNEESKKLFATLGHETGKALIITEGVVAYLTNEQAALLSSQIFSIPSFQYWIQDFARGRHRRNRHMKGLQKKLKNTPLRFSHPDPISFFAVQGWKPVETIFILDEAERVGRKMPMMFPWSLLMKIFPKKLKELGNRTYGYVMFGKA